MDNDNGLVDGLHIYNKAINNYELIKLIYKQKCQTDINKLGSVNVSKINNYNYTRLTPLHVHINEPDKLNTLLKFGADPLVIGRCNERPLRLCTNETSLRILLEHAILNKYVYNLLYEPIDEHNNIFFHVCSYKLLKICCEKVNKYIIKKCLLKRNKRNEQLPIHTIKLDEDNDINKDINDDIIEDKLDIMVKYVDVNEQDRNGNTILFTCNNINLKFLNKLIQYGINLNHENKDGERFISLISDIDIFENVISKYDIDINFKYKGTTTYYEYLNYRYNKTDISKLEIINRYKNKFTTYCKLTKSREILTYKILIGKIIPSSFTYDPYVNVISSDHIIRDNKLSEEIMDDIKLNFISIDPIIIHTIFKNCKMITESDNYNKRDLKDRHIIMKYICELVLFLINTYKYDISTLDEKGNTILFYIHYLNHIDIVDDMLKFVIDRSKTAKPILSAQSKTAKSLINVIGYKNAPCYMDIRNEYIFKVYYNNGIDVDMCIYNCFSIYTYHEDNNLINKLEEYNNKLAEYNNKTGKYSYYLGEETDDTILSSMNFHKYTFRDFVKYIYTYAKKYNIISRINQHMDNNRKFDPKAKYDTNNDLHRILFYVRVYYILNDT